MKLLSYPLGSKYIGVNSLMIAYEHRNTSQYVKHNTYCVVQVLVLQYSLYIMVQLMHLFVIKH
jgi:hypothetical protein